MELQKVFMIIKLKAEGLDSLLRKAFQKFNHLKTWLLLFEYSLANNLGQVIIKVRWQLLLL